MRRAGRLTSALVGGCMALTVLGAGSLAAFTLFVVGAPIVNNRIEADLERRVSDELAAAGHTGVTVRFSGQDATLACSGPLDDPEGAIDVAYGVHGVHSIELDRACRVTTAPGAASATTVPSATGAPAAPGALASNSAVRTKENANQAPKRRSLETISNLTTRKIVMNLVRLYTRRQALRNLSGSKLKCRLRALSQVLN